MIDGCRLLHGFLTDTGRHEHAIIEVALVDLPHVDQAQDHQTAHHELSTYLLILEQQEEGRSDDDDPERAPAVCREDGHTHLGEVLQ